MNKVKNADSNSVKDYLNLPKGYYSFSTFTFFFPTFTFYMGKARIIDSVMGWKIFEKRLILKFLFILFGICLPDPKEKFHFRGNKTMTR